MPDIYDDMEDGEAQRAYNKQRLADLKATEPERQARMAKVVPSETDGLITYAAGQLWQRGQQIGKCDGEPVYEWWPLSYWGHQ
jgi:hypothetical protein